MNNNSSTDVVADTKVVADHWDKNGGNRVKQWLHNIYVREKVLLHPLGWTKGGCWFNWLQRTYFEQPVDKALSLCCGSGQHDRRLAQVGVAKHITGMDLSEGQLERARTQAEEAGYGDMIDYQQANITECTLPENEYDVVMVVAGLHHLTNLPHVFEQMHKTLKPGGLLVITEYVGPDHMDYSPWERELYNKAVLSLDEKYRVRGSSGELLKQAGQQTREQAILRDPSEGVNSSLIMENLYRHFDIETQIDMGSSMLRECIYDLVDNFSDEDGLAELDRLIDLDRTLRASGLIECHHVFGVYKSKPVRPV